MRMSWFLPGISFRFLTLTLSLEDSRLCVDLANLLPGLPSLLGFTNLTNHPSISDVNLGLI